MPHSTRASSLSRVPSFKFPADSKPHVRTSMEKFPDMVEDERSLYPSSPSKSNGYINAPASVDRWQSRRDSALRGSSWASPGGRHGRQKSLSDAFRTIRTRRASVGANVHEVADALKAPVSPKLIVRKPLFKNKHHTDECRRFFA